jgi:integrase
MPRRAAKGLPRGIRARTLSDDRVVYYGDFRRWGGKIEALKPAKGRDATDDLDLAETLYQARILEVKRDFKDRAEDKALKRVTEAPLLFADYVTEYITARLKESKLWKGWERDARQQLERAVGYFAKRRPAITNLRDIGTPEVRQYVQWLRGEHSRRGEPFSDNSIRGHIFTLSGLFSYMVENGLLSTNPVKALPKRAKPRMKRRIAWLDPDEAALVLSAARLVASEAKPGSVPMLAELAVATMLYTGAGPAEAVALRAADISLDHGAVRIRGTKTREKTDARDRSVPLWPEYRAILERHWAAEAPGSYLLRSRTKTGHPITSTSINSDIIPLVAAKVEALRKQHRIGQGQPLWRHMEKLRPYDLRHTYCSARLMTTYLGSSIPMVMVSSEMGHSNTDTTERIYAHLGTTTRRTEHVEYPLAAYFPNLASKLVAHVAQATA